MSLPTKRRRSTRNDDHVWPLGAFAELVATASAASTQLHIDAHTSPPHITLLDNGPGHPSATLTALTAPSPWRTAATTIGSSLALLTTLSDGTATAALLTDPPHILHWSSISPHHPDLPKFLDATPWSSYDQVAAAFQSIPSSGSLLVISNLKSHPTNPTSTQLDLSDPHDIRCPSTSNIRLSTSLRAYLQLLFLRPKARIHIRGRIVRERKLASMMWGRTDFLYTPRAVQDSVATMRFGFDPHAVGDEFGMLIYCHGRLIRPFLRVGPQVPEAEVRVVGIIEADFLSPTKNMQAFERDKLYQGLMFSVDRSLKAFWGRYGTMNKVLQVHSRDVVRKWSRCDDCGYWRVVAVREGALNPEDIACTRWVCSMNVGGTVKCGAPDDEDTAVDVGNRRIFGAGKSKAEFSAALKKMRSASPIDATKLATESQPSSVEATRKRPRVPQHRTPNWAVNGVTGESLRSSPTTTAGVSAGNINVAEITTAGDSLIREPNLDLDQPTPELVSPELHFTGDGFSLSRNGLASPSEVAPVSASAGLPPTSAGLFVSSGSSPKVAYGPIEAFLRNVEGKEASLHGDVALLNRSPGRTGKGTEEVRNSLTSEAEQKISLVSSSYGLGGTPVLGRPAYPAGGGDTLKSSSSVTQDEVTKPDGVHSKVVNLMATTNEANDKVYINRSALETRNTSEGKSGVAMPTSTLSPEQTPKGRVTTQAPASPRLILTPPERRDVVRSEPVEATRSSGGELASRRETPNRLSENEFGGKGDPKQLLQHRETVVVDGCKPDAGDDITTNAYNGIQNQDKTPPNIRQGTDESRLPSSRSEGTPRYGGYRFARGSKGKGKLGSGKIPMQSAPDPPQLTGGVTTSSALQMNANLGNESRIEDDNSVDDAEVRSSRQEGSKRQSAVGRRESPLMSLGNARGDRQHSAAERNNGALQGGPLDEVDMTRLLDFDQDAAIKTPNLHERADAPNQSIAPGARVESDNYELLLGRTMRTRPNDKAPISPGDLSQSQRRHADHGRQRNGAESPTYEPMDMGSDGTEPFEKEAEHQIRHPADQGRSTNGVHMQSTMKRRIKHTPNSMTRKDLTVSGKRISPLGGSPEMLRDAPDRSLGTKRRHESDQTTGNEGHTEDYRRSEEYGNNTHKGTNSKRNDDAQRQRLEIDKRRRLGVDSLAVATEAAASAAQAALGDLGTNELIRGNGGVPSHSFPVEMTWSQLALSAAVAAGAAAAAATTAKQSQQGNQVAGSRDSDRTNKKLRTLISLLVPTADEDKLNDMETFDMERVAKEIEHRIKQDVKGDAVRAVSKQLESSRTELQSETKALHKLRNLVHIFLDRVVGIWQTDDTQEPIESQLEYYLRLVDALPADRPN